MSKIAMAAAFGAGYVFGARAGRERYKEIRQKAHTVWQSPKVQERAAKVQEVVKDKLAARPGGGSGTHADTNHRSEDRPGEAGSVDATPHPQRHGWPKDENGADPDETSQLGTVRPGGDLR